MRAAAHATVAPVPAEAIHLTALREVSHGRSLDPAAKRCLARFDAVARLGSVAPDLPYFDRYLEEVARYLTRRPSRPSPWGASVHEGGAIELVFATLAEARDARSAVLAALAMGLASHACIDRSIHPLVNALARRYPERATHDACHREVEKLQSILFHERHFGRDLMGTREVVRLVAVPALALLASEEVGPALARAYGRAVGARDVAPALRRMASGYAIHARLLGPPLGGRIAPRAEKERAAPLVSRGPWGTFERVLEDAIALSAPVLDAVWSAFIADERDAARALEALEALLPRGTIEGQGLAVDLDEAFVVAAPSEVLA